KVWLVILPEDIDCPVVVDTGDQGRGRVRLAEVEAAEVIPYARRRRYEARGFRINDDLVCIAVQEVCEQTFTSAGRKDDLLLTLPGSFGRILLSFSFFPLGSCSVRIRCIVRRQDTDALGRPLFRQTTYQFFHVILQKRTHFRTIQRWPS